ncbi:MAG: trypsin-like peptidase domain-containing protein [Oligoflexia bacterium]|nr:trypsin-like peptidase domain-containing protein [Oligoflexia bacterium]
MKPASFATAFLPPAFGLLPFCLLLGAGAAMAAPPPVPHLPDLVERILPGVVNISSVTVLTRPIFGMDEFLHFWGLPQERRQTQTSLGTGFIIDKDGFVITNGHVVEHASEVSVTLLDKRVLRAKIIGKDQKTDLALLQLRDKERKVPEGLVPVPLGNSDAVRIAETVFAVGNPFGLQHTVTTGIISAKNRTIGQGPFDNFLQTDASINPGNSGGPLFNLSGEVVGINTVIYSRTGQSGGLGFAIPINEAKRLLPDLKRYGRVPRPWLGILGERITPPMAQYYDLPVTQGVLVYNLVNDGPADRAGLRQGDILISIGETEVIEPFDIERALAKHRPTENVTAKVRRGRRTLDVKLRLEELPRLDTVPKGIL